jgi:hypothetical protein
VNRSQWPVLHEQAYAGYPNLLRLVYQHVALAVPLPARLPICGILLHCLYPTPLVIAVQDQAEFYEYTLWQVDRTPFDDLAEARRQRYPTVLELPETASRAIYPECLVVPL